MPTTPVGHDLRSAPPHPPPGKVLQGLRVRLGAWLSLRTVLTLLGVGSLLALVLILMDAAIDLADNTRAASPWLLAITALAVLGLGLWSWLRFSEQRLARSFERANPALGNRLINAVQLAGQAGATPVEQLLRDEAVELGRATAAGVQVWPMLRRGVQAAGITAGIGLGAWLLFLALGAEVWHAVLPRFTDPHGDHPPYSKLKFEVVPGRTNVLYAGQVEIRARTSGLPVDKLWLVSQSGSNTTRTLMFLAPDKSFFQTLANLREPAEYFVTDGKARSHRFPIEVRYTPRITLAEATFTFPGYTGKPPRTGKLADEPQALPEETAVSFRIASNRPLKSGTLNLTPVLGGKARQVPLAPEAQNTVVRGDFTLTEPVVFTLSVRDVQDLACAEPLQGRFNILPDERPRITVLEPGRDAVATPAISVPIKVQAQDDYGVNRVYWLRGHNRSIERPFNLKLALKPGPQSIEAGGAFELAKLGVRPGDSIEYYFEAADNYPKGPNLALSRIYRLEIISQEQFDEILRQAAARKALFEPYLQLDRWLQRLAERARSLAEKSARESDPATTSAAMKDLDEDLAQYESELAKLLASSPLFDIEKAFRNTLEQQQQQMGEAREELKSAMGGGNSRSEQLAKIAKQLSEMARKEREEVGEPAREIAVVANLLSRADTFVKLAQEQAALAKMLRRFADKTTPLTRLEELELQELADRQRKIEGALRDLMALLPELLAQVPDDPAYENLRGDVEAFIQAVKDAEIEKDLGEAGRLLANAEGKPGYETAQRAADKMDALISKCQSMSQDGQACLRFRPSMNQGLGNTLQQILAAMGAGPGRNGGGRDGYSMFANDFSLYGSNAMLAGEQAGGRGDRGRGNAPLSERVTGDARDPGLKPPAATGSVRLQPDAKFPLRYRDLVGEYFRAIAESQDQPEPKR